MEQKYQVGDVVFLNSCGVPMTVTRAYVKTHDNGLAEECFSGYHYEVVWMNAEGEIQRAAFADPCLNDIGSEDDGQCGSEGCPQCSPGGN